MQRSASTASGSRNEAELSVDERTERLIDVRVGSATDGRVPISMVERSLAAGAFHWAGLVAVAVAALFADQLTKSIVISQLELGEAVDIGAGFTIHHVKNPGIAFGLFGGWAGPVTILTAIAVVWMLGYFAKAGARHPVLPVALGLLIGGALSNLVDRIRIGHVTDFLDPPYWPAFNLADTFICVGVAILLMALVVAERAPFFRGRSATRRA
jgi:signal peptidase II